MKRLIALLLFVGIATAAHADTFNFSYSGTGYSGSGTFTGTATGTSGQYLITGISGTANGSTISSLLAPGAFPTSSPPANDNLLYLSSGSTYFDLDGVSFRTSAGVNYNLYYGYNDYTGTSAYNILSGKRSSDTAGAALTSISVTAATPEPSSLALLGTGVLGVVGAVRRRLAA